MGLRNITESKSVGTEDNSPDQLREDTERLLADCDEDIESKGECIAAPGNKSSSIDEEPIDAKIEVDPMNGPMSDSSVDVFSASLEALLLTLEEESSADSAEDDAMTGEQGSVALEGADSNSDGSESNSAPDVPSEIEEAATAFKSSLEHMPLPATDPDVTPSGGVSPVADIHPEPKAVKSKNERANSSRQEPTTFSETPLESVLVGLRDSILDHDSEPDPSKRPPTSDGIPKSTSEALPKFKSRPRMRICGQCGHETRLRNESCKQCGHVDPSLGILDAVIAGDIRKVDRILLARPHLIGTRTSNHAWSLLHMAASGGNPKMVELLLSRGASVNASTKDGKMPLHYAAGKGHLEIVQCLIANHADVQATYSGKTPLDVASAKGRDEVVAYLRKRRWP